MLRRQRTGSVVCPSCGRLTGVADERCFNCGRLRPGMWGFAGALRRFGADTGFVQLVLGGCIVLYAATLFAGGGPAPAGGPFSIFPSTNEALARFGASGSRLLFGVGRWWTPLSAGWLHGDLLHLFFNLLWLRQLAPITAELYGASRMVILYTLASAAGFLLTSTVGAFLPVLGGAWLTVGASAAIFGLLGAQVRAGRRGASGRALTTQAWGFAVLLFVYGLVSEHVDNWAHLGGFAGGYLAAVWLDPLKPERTDHAVGALLCLVATAGAIVASLLVG